MRIKRGRQFEFTVIIRYELSYNHARKKNIFTCSLIPSLRTENLIAQYHSVSVIMHMSSACPWGRTPGQPGEYVGEYKGINWLLCPWAGENSRHCFEFEGRGWGNSKFCKITDANLGDIRGICRFPQPINTGNFLGIRPQFNTGNSN